MAVPMHPDLGGLAAFVGTWEGAGAGDYPSIAAFRYRERVTFAHVGKPFLAYDQRTWHPEHGGPMHSETGYLRVAPATADPGAIPAGDGADDAITVECMLAHPTGIVEIEEGTLQASVLRLQTSSIGLSRTAKSVRSLRREFRLDGDALTYDVWMAYADIPETHHLQATLRRSS